MMDVPLADVRYRFLPITQDAVRGSLTEGLSLVDRRLTALLAAFHGGGELLTEVGIAADIDVGPLDEPDELRLRKELEPVGQGSQRSLDTLMHLGLKVGDELGDGLPSQGMRQMKRLDIIDSGDLDGQGLPGLLPLPRTARRDAADRAADRHAYAVLELGVAAAQHGEVAGVRSVDGRLLVESLRREREGIADFWRIDAASSRKSSTLGIGCAKRSARAGLAK